MPRLPLPTYQLPTPEEAGAKRFSPGLALGAVLSAGVAIILMLLCFYYPAVQSGAHDLPVAISGPAAQVAQLEAALNSGASAGAFDFQPFTDDAAVQSAITSREVVGGLSIGDAGVTIYTAGAAGSVYKNVLGELANLLRTTLPAGAQLNTVDLVPLPSADPLGVGISALGLPLAFGGLVSGVLLTVACRRRRAAQLALTLVTCALVGLSAAALLRHFGTLPAGLGSDFWKIAGVLGAGLAANSFLVQALYQWFGMPGVGIASAFLTFISNPIAGLATGPQWLPDSFASFGQALSIGATGTLVRSLAFFPAASLKYPALVLAAWLVGGFLLALLAIRPAVQQPSAAESH